MTINNLLIINWNSKLKQNHLESSNEKVFKLILPFLGPELFLGSCLLFFVGAGEVFEGVDLLALVLLSCELHGGGGGMADSVKL